MRGGGGIVSGDRDAGAGLAGAGGNTAAHVPLHGSIRSTTSTTGSMDGISMGGGEHDAGAGKRGGVGGGGVSAVGGGGDGDGGGGGGGGGDGGAGGVFDRGDDERDDHPSPLFPLFSPPRRGVSAGAGGGGGDGGIFGLGTASAAGGRLSPSIGVPPSTLQSTLQLGLLNSVSPSLLLGTGAGAWMGATGGGVGGTATGGFGMSAAAPSFVQAPQLGPLLLSQMGPQSSWGGLSVRSKGSLRGRCIVREDFVGTTSWPDSRGVQSDSLLQRSPVGCWPEGL